MTSTMALVIEPVFVACMDQVKINRLIEQKVITVGNVYMYTQRLEETNRASEVIDLTESEDEEVAQFFDRRTSPPPCFSSPIESSNVTLFLASNVGRIQSGIDALKRSIGEYRNIGKKTVVQASSRIEIKSTLVHTQEKTDFLKPFGFLSI